MKSLHFFFRKFFWFSILFSFYICDIWVIVLICVSLSVLAHGCFWGRKFVFCMVSLWFWWSCWVGYQLHTAGHLSQCRKICAFLGDGVCQMASQWRMAMDTPSPDAGLPAFSLLCWLPLPKSSVAATLVSSGLITPDKSCLLHCYSLLLRRGDWGLSNSYLLVLLGGRTTGSFYKRNLLRLPPPACFWLFSAIY